MALIHHGDLFDVLPTLEAESIDAVVTDPPYELKFMGKHWDGSGVAFRVETWREVLRVMKPGAYLVAFGAPRTYHHMATAIEDAGFEIRDSLSWFYGSGFPKNLNLGDGKGTALKPAHEPIALAWKPFKGTITACHATHGTAALSVDACRIEGNKRKPGYREPGTPHEKRGSVWDEGSGFRNRPAGDDLGRWPANVILDEEAAALLDEQTGEWKSAPQGKGGNWNPPNSILQAGCKEHGKSTNYDDFGGASRFYYVAKSSREERDFGTDGLTTMPRDDSRKEGNPGGDNPRNRGLQLRGNHHPTVKPVELMRWLVKLVTPVGGLVLDPFTGSGTTGMACRYESRRFIGIEREAEYVAIAERRIAAVAPLFGEATA